MRLRWIVISYFLIGGGVAIALGVLGLAWFGAGTISPAMLAKLSVVTEKGLEPLPVEISNLELAMALTYAAGAGFGAFFVGRASPHRSTIEPAIAAALVVGSFLLAIYLSPMGKILLNLTQGNLERLASILAATGIVAGLVGAALGELADIGAGRTGPLRQTGLALLITTGALWTSLMIFGVVYANEVAKQALANLGNPNTNEVVEFSLRRVATFVGIAASCAAAAAGLAGQLGALGRAVGPAAVAALLVFGGAAAAVGLILELELGVVIGFSIASGTLAAAIGAASAYLVWLGRGRPRQSR